MGDGIPIFNGGSPTMLSVIDALCEVTEQMSQVIRQQAEVIEQEKIANAAVDDLARKREDIDRKMDSIEFNLRRINT